MSGARSGAQFAADVLARAGVGTIFGLPGSTEASLLETLRERAEPRYVLGLHEGAVVSMADGFARVTGRPGDGDPHFAEAGGLGSVEGPLAAIRHRQLFHLKGRSCRQQPVRYPRGHVAGTEGALEFVRRDKHPHTAHRDALLPRGRPSASSQPKDSSGLPADGRYSSPT